LPQDIQYITRKDLDVSKYDTCISNAINSRIYAYSWYLDVVSDAWDVLVLGDYNAVMPLPKRRFFFIKYIYTPSWVQQLGVFSRDIVDDNLVALFLKSIPKKFKKVSVYLNNLFSIENNFITQRDNYVLNLNLDYKDLFKGYSKNRKQSLKKINTDYLEIIESERHQNIISFYYQYIFKKSGLKDIDMQNLNSLLNRCYKLNKAVTVEAVSSDDGKSLGGAVFLIDNNRIYYLFSALSTEGKKEQVMTLIIDYMIKKYVNSEYQLDFEGSMIPGIASFFKSFGAKNIPYLFFEKPLFLF